MPNGWITLKPGAKAHLAIQHMPAKRSRGMSAEEVLQVYREVAAQDAPVKTDGHTIPWSPSDIPARFDRELKVLSAIAGRVTINTPDAFINAAMAALVTAADGVWDDRIGAYLHGGVAWRTPLLGWRVAYAGDVFVWHERTRAHFDRFSAKQNTSPIANRIPAAEDNAYFARNETALHPTTSITTAWPPASRS